MHKSGVSLGCVQGARTPANGIAGEPMAALVAGSKLLGTHTYIPYMYVCLHTPRIRRKVAQTPSLCGWNVEVAKDHTVSISPFEVLKTIADSFFR